MEEVHTNSQVRSAVLISGKPGTFIAGADIQMINAMDSAASAAKGSAEAQDFIANQIEASKKPIVAAINGSCLGMGLEVMLVALLLIIESILFLNFSHIDVKLLI